MTGVRFNMKKMLLVMLSLVSIKSFNCCPWLCKSKHLVSKPTSYDPDFALDLQPVEPEVTLAAGTGLASNIFRFKTDNRPGLDKSVALHAGITKRQLKEVIVRACGHSDYTNIGYCVKIYNGSRPGLVEITKSHDELVKAEIIERILSFQDSLVVVDPI